MDPLAHTLLGAALARTKLGRERPLAMPVLVLAANAPDIDVIAYFWSSDTALAFRRGPTHGPIGLAVLLWLYLDSQITDTKDLEFRLRVTDPTESAQHDLSAGVTLALQLPRDQFTLVEFRDGLENQVISSVALTFRGPRHLINRLEENLGFTVTPTSEDLRKIENYFEFDARMIRARNPEFQSLLTGMTPRLVHAVVGRNEQRAVTVTPDLVDVKPPATTVDR